MKKLVAFGPLFAIVVIFAMMLSGCSQYIDKRNVKRLQSYSIQYRPEFLKLSNEINPCFTGKAKSDTQVTHGKPDTTITWSFISKPPASVFTLGGSSFIGSGGTFTITPKADTIQVPGATKTIRITIPVLTTIHDTVTDQRKVNALRAEKKVKSDSLVIVKTQYKDVDHKKNIYLWILIGLASIVAIALGIKAYLFLSGGAAVKAGITAADLIKKL